MDSAPQLDYSKVELGYYRYGKFAGAYPLVVILAFCTLFACLCIPLGDAEMNNNPADLWIEEKGSVRDEIDYTEKYKLDSQSASEELVIHLAEPQGDDVLTAEILNDHYSVLKELYEIKVTLDGEEFGYTDLCYLSSLAYVIQCMRITVLDCFQEGQYDVPDAMLEYLGLSEMSAGLSAQFGVDVKVTTYNYCLFYPLVWIGTTQEGGDTSTIPPIDYFGECRYFFQTASEAQYFYLAQAYANTYTTMVEATKTAAGDSRPYSVLSDAEKDAYMSAALAGMGAPFGLENIPLASGGYVLDTNMPVAEDLSEVVSGTCNFWDGGPAGLDVIPSVPRDLVVGGITYDRENPESIEKAEALQMIVMLQGTEQLINTWSAEPRPEDCTSMFGTDGSDPCPPPYGRGKVYTADFVDDVKTEWREKYLEVIGDEVSPYFDHSVAYAYSSDNLGSILDDYAEANGPLIFTGYALMFVYACYSLGVYNRRTENFFIDSRCLLGLFGVCLVVLALCAGLSMTSMMGIEFNASTTQALPFLMLGLGVDDMFILAHSFPLTDLHTAVPDLTGRTLAAAGPSVTLTSFTNFIALLMGRLAKMPLVINFSTQAAVCVITNWVLMVFVFPALMSLDARRRRERRYDLCPVLTVPRDESKVPKPPKDPWLKETFLRQLYLPFIKHWIGQVCVLCVFLSFFASAMWGVSEIELGILQSDVIPEGTQEKDFVDAREEYFFFYPVTVATKEIDYPSKQGRILALFDEFENSGWCEVGATRPWLQQYIEWGTLCGVTMPVAAMALYSSDPADADVTYVDPSNPDITYYPNHGEAGAYTIEGYDTEFYSTEDECLATYGLYNKFCDPTSTATGIRVETSLGVETTGQGKCGPLYGCYSEFADASYPDTLVMVGGGRGGGSGAVVDFDDCLQTWWDVDDTASARTPYFPYSDLASQTIDFPLQFAEMSFYVNNLDTIDRMVDFIDDTRDIVDKYGDLDAYPGGYPYWYYDQYRYIESMTWGTIGYALLVTFFCCLLMLVGVTSSSHALKDSLLYGAWGSLILVTVILLVCAEVYGYMGIAGIKMSALPAISLIMTVGVSVEFTAHIVLAFLHAPGDRHSRITVALEHLLVPMVDGSATTIVGVLMLAASPFNYIVLYYFVVYLFIILFGLINGLLLLPVILVVAGPPSLAEKDIFFSSMLEDGIEMASK